MTTRAQTRAQALMQASALAARLLARAAAPRVQPLAAKPAPLAQLARFARARWLVFQPL